MWKASGPADFNHLLPLNAALQVSVLPWSVWFHAGGAENGSENMMNEGKGVWVSGFTLVFRKISAAALGNTYSTGVSSW